jgi:uncharacterized protein YggE
LAAFVLPALARAEDPKPTVNVNGWAAIEKMPEILRLKIEIPATGPDMKQALAKLKSKREAAAKKLKEMGVAETAISFESAKIAADPAEAMRKRMAMMGNREGADKAAEEDAKPPKVNVSAVLQAEWPIKVQDAEELLIFAGDLQDKIKAADLAGLKKEKPSEEEEEKAAEVRERFGGYENDRVPPGEPVILYVCKVSEQENAKLLADAVAKAKTRAVQMATAVGMQLDSLFNITSMEGGPGRGYGMNLQFAGDYQMMQRVRAFMPPETADNSEAIGVEPKKITHGIGVSLAYKLK